MNCLYSDGSQTGTVWLPFTNAVIVRIFQKTKVLQTVTNFLICEICGSFLFVNTENIDFVVCFQKLKLHNLKICSNCSFGAPHGGQTQSSGKF